MDSDTCSGSSCRLSIDHLRYQ